MPYSPAVLWITFILIVVFLLYFDLCVLHPKTRIIHMREALTWSILWILIALLFNLGYAFVAGAHNGLKFFTGYVIERSLSIDNIFVFLVILRYFKVPTLYQQNVIFWGIAGAIVIRGFFIWLGISLIEKFHWVIYILGMILIISGFNLFFEKDKELHPEKNPVLKLFRLFFPITHDYEGDHYFVTKQHRIWATPLFVTLLIIATTDILFAVDSIPAILAITTDPFIVYSSNVFALLGLRAMYFALAASMGLFHYLHYGLALILVFIGGKMLLDQWIEIPLGLTLGFVAVTLSITILFSVFSARPKK